MVVSLSIQRMKCLADSRDRMARPPTKTQTGLVVARGEAIVDWMNRTPPVGLQCNPGAVVDFHRLFELISDSRSRRIEGRRFRYH